MEETIMVEDNNLNGPVRRNSSDSYSIEDIKKNFDNLFVQEDIPTRPQAKELIQELIQDFSEYNTDFLKEYLDVLQNSDPLAVTDVSNNIVFTIEAVLEQQSNSNQKWKEPVLVVLLGWMCVAVLCLVDPHMQSPYRALNELLLHTTIKERVRLASALWRHLSPALLIELADITTRPKFQPGPNEPSEPETTLSDLLLRAALCSLQPERQEPQWLSGPLYMEEAAAGISNAWATADVIGSSLLVQLAARTQSESALFTIAKGAPAKPLKVNIEVSKLKLLFQDEEKNNVTGTSKKKNNRKEEE